MRAKIAEMYHRERTGYSIKGAMAVDRDLSYVFADKILNLFPSLEGIVVEEECIEDEPTIEHALNCICHGTGTITRNAEWGDVEIRAHSTQPSFWIDPDKPKPEPEITLQLVLKSGGRLKIK